MESLSLQLQNPCSLLLHILPSKEVGHAMFMVLQTGYKTYMTVFLFLTQTKFHYKTHIMTEEFTNFRDS